MTSLLVCIYGPNNDVESGVNFVSTANQKYHLANPASLDYDNIH
jgi:hypothetical protein